MATITLTNVINAPLRAQFAGLPQLNPGGSFTVEDKDMRTIHFALINEGKLSASPTPDPYFAANATRLPVADELLPDASKSLFEPTTPGDWPAPPATTADALDDLASRGVATAALAGEGGSKFASLDETLVIPGATAFVETAGSIPAGAVLHSVQVNLETAVTQTTGTEVGLGDDSPDPDRFDEQALLAQNSKLGGMVDGFAVEAAARKLRFYSTDGAGAAAGTLDTGTVRIKAVYEIAEDLPDA